MTKSIRFVSGFLLGAALLTATMLAAQDPRVVGVPEGNGRPILVDGVFTPGEWDDAMKIEVRPHVQVFLKRTTEFVFVGIKYTPFVLEFVDLFISPDGKTIHQLHASAQIGERPVVNTPGTQEQSPFVWGNTTGWYANEIRWNEHRVEAMMKEGKGRGQAQMASVYKYDGFEFQIRRSKFGSDRWFVRLESSNSRDQSKPIVHPDGTDTASTRGWLAVAFK